MNATERERPNGGSSEPPTQADMPRPAWPRLVAIGVGVATAVAIAWRNRFFYHDDTFIGLRYVANWLAGQGLVWNPGERVEGYTNFLHLVGVALLGAAGVDLVSAPRVVNCIAWLALLVAFPFVARRLTSPDGVAASACLLLASVPLVTWVWGGLEAPLLGALLFAGHAGLLRAMSADAPLGPAAGAGAAFALAALTRPDAVLFVPIAAAALAWGGRASRPLRVRSVLLVVAIPALAISLQLFGRLVYYGDWLPNTFYAKLVGTPPRHGWLGARYLASFATTPPFLPALAAVGGGLAVWRRRDPAALVLIAGCTVYAAYVALAGGDHMPAQRLLVPLVPLLALLFGLGIAGLPARITTPTLLATAVLVALQLVVRPAQRMDEAAFVGSIVGPHIHAHWPTGSLVALNTAGSVPFFSPDQRFIDMLGLNDRAIARRKVTRLRTPWQLLPGHAKGWGAYVLGRAPDYVILGTAEGLPSPVFLSGVELAALPEFRRCYEQRKERIPYDPSFAVRAVERANPLVLTYFQRVCETPPR